jgi:hypothetical protein
VEQYTALVRQATKERGLVEIDAYEQDAASAMEFIAQRSAWLAATPLLGGQAGASSGSAG